MNKPIFFLGQRWISNAEAELGLGIVAEVDARRVSLSFPAAAEERVYSIDNAPLSRIEYVVGEELKTAEGVHFTVSERLEQGGCYGYSGVTADGESILIHEIDLDSFVHFNKPLDRLLAGQVDKPHRYQLRLETQEQLHRLHNTDVHGLLGPRVQLLPHQFYIAHQVARRHAPRVLLADEVGLGKTIEAGLIIHQQLFTGRARRVLVLLPDSLIHQWLVEMLRRFNLWFSVFDQERCEAIEGEDGADSINPFETEQRVLCPLSLLVDNPRRLQQAVEAGWDLLCVDEAHHLSWAPDNISPAYQGVETLAQQVPGLLLLTATPEQLGLESHFARLRLLDPDRYHDLEQFVEEEQQFKPLNQFVQELLATESPLALLQEVQSQSLLTELLGADSYQRHLAEFSDADGEAQADLVQSLIDQLIDRHGTGRVLFRNTRQTVSGFPGRQLEPYPLPLPEEHHEAFHSADFKASLQPEAIFGADWLLTDARVPWLTDWLKEHRNDKVLLICSQAETALQLEQHLRLRVGFRTSVFHEGMSILERDRAAAYFADLEEGAQLLICSEIGSEGRNFQFAHQLVMFDLPTNPDLLEQRIGRLDRIGQLREVCIHVPFYEDSPQQWLFDWLHEGMNAFLSTCPAGETLYEAFFESLSALTSEDAVDLLPELLTATQTKNEQLLAAMKEGRDRLLELNSCREVQAEALIDTVDEQSAPAALAQYMGRVFDQFGVDQEHQNAQVAIIRPSEHMLIDCFPGLDEEGMSLTYSRNQALLREEIEFMTWEHPMVQGVMELIANGEMGNTGICTLKLPPIKPGTLMLESYFVPVCTGPRGLQLKRYLPDASVRVLLDAEGRDLSQLLTPAHMLKLAGPVGKVQIPQIIRHAREEIQTLAERSEQLVAEQQAALITAALDKMRSIQGQELQRLQELAQVNPAIRQSELDYVQAQEEILAEYLSATQLQLDSIRVIIAT